ncbi:MAG TPA: PAS domain S-box protein [Chthoniobacterales bacterium]|nr:PAS domain S-box protein [Chthoniobacterales bacterium]
MKTPGADFQKTINALLAERGERQRAEEALRISEQRLQDILDNTTAVVFVKDLELRYILVNREYERRHQVQREQIRGKNDFDIHPQDVAEKVRANDRHVIEAGAPVQFEESVPMAEGERQYVVVKFLLRDRSAKPYAVCGIATDITELKRSEELQARRARQAALRADIHGAFCRGAESTLQTMLQRSAEAIVRHLDGVSARLWTLNDQQNTLELQASAGPETPVNGEHLLVNEITPDQARGPVDNLRMGPITPEDNPHLTNGLLNDDGIDQPKSEDPQGAGYPLLVEGRLVGLLELLAHESLGQDTLEALEVVADGVAQGIERKRGEEKLARLNRTLQTLYQCNQALVRANEEYELLQSVCRILVEVGGLRMAWVGYREFNQDKTVRPVAQAGYEAGYLARINITWGDTDNGRGPTGTAIRTATTCWTNDNQTDPQLAPWRAEDLSHGYASSISLPLTSNGQAFGALSLHAEEPYAFTESAIEQYTDLASNLAYGVMALRTREERKRAESEVRQLNASLEKRVVDRTIELVRSNEQLKQAEEQLRKHGEQVQIHRDVLLELARSDKSDLEKALRKICSISAATLEVARVSYWSLQDNNSTISCEVLYLRSLESCDQEFKGARLGFSDCPAYFEALATKRPIVADRVLMNPATSCLENYLRSFGISSMLDAPIWVRGEVVGVLCHEHVGPPRDWSAEEIDFVAALASMVSLALEESSRAHSERLLRESEEKFRALFEGTSQAVVLHDENGIFDANPSWLQLLGYSKLQDVIGKRPAEVSAPIQPGGERAEMLEKKYIAHALSNGSARFEWVVLHRDGTEIPIEVFLTPIQLGGRQLIQAVCIDITVRKQAEEELRQSETRLRESEARFSTAFRASPVLVTITRLSDATFIEANDAFVRWIGLSHESIVGHDTRELGIWVDLNERAKFLSDLQRLGSLNDVECQLRSHRGSIHSILLTADLIEINREPHMLVSGLDITQRKQAEAELLRTLAREKELGQLRSKFVSMVSHEFRTPLAIIQSSAEILDDYLDQLENAERKDHLESIRKNTRRMAALMEETLLIGSFDAGKMEFKPAPLELPSFVRRLVDEVHSATNRRCPVELFHAEMPAMAQADGRLLRHIFTNLLTNAVKYSDSGRTVHFEIVGDRSEIVCIIRDRGIGIPEPDREWLFNAFHRGQNVGDRPGTGLGLIIVKRCVDLHGGTIKVDSKLGEGTVVTVRLPI